MSSSDEYDKLRKDYAACSDVESRIWRDYLQAVNSGNPHSELFIAWQRKRDECRELRKRMLAAIFRTKP